MRNRLLICCAVLICFAGCKKENANKTDNLTSQQAANIIALVVSVNANGYGNLKNDVAQYAQTLPTAGKGCGVIDSFAMARQEFSNNTINFNYAMGYHYILNCQAPDNLSADVSYNGSFDSSSFSVMDLGTLTGTLFSISDNAANYSLNAVYTSNGTYKAIDDTGFAGDFTVSLDVKDVLLNKSTRSTAGGTGTVTLSGSVKNKNTFNFTGSLTFINSNTTQLVLNGTRYSLDMHTGMATAN